MWLVLTIATGAVFAGTIVALYLRPFGAKDWQVALSGGVLAWVLSPLSLGEGLEILGESWNIVLFFLGLMLIAAGAEATGLYAIAAQLLARSGSGRTSVLAVLATGTVITAVLSNDATPLVLTPAIFAASRARNIGPTDSAFAATFVADGASLILPVSNPVNLLFYERFDLSFGHYAATILPAALAGTAALWLATLVRRPANILLATPALLPESASLVTKPGLQRAGVAIILVLAPCYVVGAIAGIPLGAISVAGGLVLLTAILLSGGFNRHRYRRHLSPGLFPFIAGLLILVESATAANLLDPLGELLDSLSGQPELLAVTGSALIAMVLANLMNNWPSALLIAATIAATGDANDSLIAGALIGSTIGANLTIVGSLSTVFWLTLARNEGATYSPALYARRAFFPTIAGVLAACFVAWLV